MGGSGESGVAQRPGASLARRPLHFFFVADCSGSMATDGKMPALNIAVREALPHLVGVAEQNPHSELLVRVLSFSNGAHWHVADPVPVGDLVWNDLAAGGMSDLGEALTILAGQLETPPMETRALPPAIVLISDGLPTDDWESGLTRLLATPWGGRAVRMAIGIGRDADVEVLSAFIGDEAVRPISASNPEQLSRLLRWATVHAGRAASTLAQDAAPPSAEFATVSDVVW